MSLLVSTQKRGFPAPPETVNTALGKSLYPWQEDAVSTIDGHLRTKFVSPTGSGKSAVISVAADLRRARGMNCLIVVPQKHIAKSFEDFTFLRSSTGVLHTGKVDDPFKLMGDTADIKKTLAQWFKGKGSIAVTTMQSLVNTYKYMQESDTLDSEIFSNLFVVQDEAHHIAVAGSDEDSALSVVDRNRLGEFYQYLLTHTSAEMLIVSATHFRGDGLPLFMAEAAKKFDGEYVREFVEHWKWLSLQHFNLDMIGYDSDPRDTLLQVIKLEPNQKHIICLPPTNHRIRREGQWVERLIQGIRDMGLRPLDLVDTEGREGRKDQLRADSDAFSGGADSTIDVVVTVNLMREGTDWVPATRIHDLAPSRSSTRTVQTLGRLLRKDWKGRKQSLTYWMYFQNLQANADDENIREHAADRTNIALASLLILDQLFTPIRDDWDLRDRETPPEDKKPLLTLLEAREKFLGDQATAIEGKLFLLLTQKKLQNGGSLTARDIEWATGEALKGSDLPCVGRKPDTLAAKRVLAKICESIGAATLGVPESNKAISPPLTGDFMGLDPSKIRDAGFDETKRGEGLFTFGTRTDTEGFEKLGSIVKNLQKMNPVAEILSTRLGAPKSKKIVRKEKSLRRKAKQAPEKLTPEERLLFGPAEEKNQI